MTMPEPNIPATTLRQGALVRMLRAAGRLQRALEAVCAEHGLTHDQYNVLRILRGAHPAGHPRYAIADRLLSRAPDVTRLLGRLVRSGLVERYRSAEDQRLSMSRATDRALRLLERIDPEIHAVHERSAAELDDSEVRRLSELCGRIARPAGLE